MRLETTLGAVSVRDRTVTLVLLLAAAVAWLSVAVVFTTISPIGNAGAQLLGALALGAAVGLTAWPLLWASGRRGDRDTTTSDLVTSGRRSGLIGLVISILVVLRVLDAVALPVLIFLVASAILVEVAFTLRR